MYDFILATTTDDDSMLNRDPLEILIELEEANDED